MTPEHALVQLLKLEPLTDYDIVKYTGWDCGKVEKTLEKCIASRKVEAKDGLYMPTMRSEKRGKDAQCAQPAMSDVWSYWDN
jgi:hypothetical protein